METERFVNKAVEAGHVPQGFVIEGGISVLDFSSKESNLGGIFG